MAIGKTRIISSGQAHRLSPCATCAAKAGTANTPVPSSEVDNSPTPCAKLSSCLSPLTANHPVYPSSFKLQRCYLRLPTPVTYKSKLLGMGKLVAAVLYRDVQMPRVQGCTESGQLEIHRV
ncbi:hypothetical protein D3C78_1224850 [compost metagenome]